MVIAKHCGPLLGCKGTTEFIYSHFLCQFSSFLLKNCDWIFKSWGFKKKKKRYLFIFCLFLKKKIINSCLLRANAGRYLRSNSLWQVSLNKSSEDLNQMKTQKNCALDFKVLKWATAAFRLGMAEL